MEQNKCFKCGSTRFVIKHHTSYNPEVVVDCCRSCHTKIHNRVRKEGVCKYSVEEIQNLSKKSSLKRHDVRTIPFYDKMIENIRLYESISYSQKTGTVTIASGFLPSNNKHIWIEEI